MAVRGVQDQHVDAGGQEFRGPPGDIAVDPDGGGHLEPAGRVQRGPVQRGAQGALPGEDAGQDAVPLHGRKVGPGSVHRFEGAAQAGARSGSGAAVGRAVQHGRVQHQRLVAHHRGERGEPVLALAVGGPDDAGDGTGVIHDHDGPVRTLAHQVQGINDGVGRRQRDRGFQDGVAGLDPGRHVADHVERDVLRQHRQSAAPGHGLGHALAGHRRHVRRHERNRGPRPVVRGQVHVQPGGDVGTGRYQEEVRIGQVGGGLGQETHGCSLK